MAYFHLLLKSSKTNKLDCKILANVSKLPNSIKNNYIPHSNHLDDIPIAPR